MSGFVFKAVKIKPEYRAVATGRIAECRLSGSESLCYRSKLKFKAYVQVKGVERLLVLPFSQDLGFIPHWKLAWHVEQARRCPVLPFMTGNEIMVEYNQKKPKKCNWIEATKMNFTREES